MGREGHRQAIIAAPAPLDTLYTPAVATQPLPTTLARATAALERGRGAEAAQVLAPALRSGTLSRQDELSVRIALAEAWLLQDDLVQAAAALGRTPDTLREQISDGQLSALWRLHGRLTFKRGEQSRAIAMHSRALKQAELAHDSRAIGLAHYELALVAISRSFTRCPQCCLHRPAAPMKRARPSVKANAFPWRFLQTMCLQALCTT